MDYLQGNYAQSQLPRNESVTEQQTGKCMSGKAFGYWEENIISIHDGERYEDKKLVGGEVILMHNLSW